MNVTRLLIKITGSFLTFHDPDALIARIKSLAAQLKILASRNYKVALLIGGGNIFRGSEHGKRLSITPSRGHTIGMLATVINAVMLADLLSHEELKTTLLSAFPVPGIARVVSAENITTAFQQEHIIIFGGGIGTPFFSTDTAAIIRALEIQAHTVWKATSVPGVFDADPQTHKNAQLLPNITFQYALNNKLQIMDQTALVLAQQHHLVIKVFDIFTQDALLKATDDPHFGSVIKTT